MVTAKATTLTFGIGLNVMGAIRTATQQNHRYNANMGM